MLQEKIVNWYIKNKRELSFRASKNPYHIWISEVMLQQTQVVTMLPYFDRFIEKYKTPIELANTSLEEVLIDLQGLGYYRRFRMMHKAAQVIKDNFNGVFPTEYKDVISLPGVGKYTAGAIMSIAYDKPYSAVDGNVIRVLSRVFEVDGDMRKNSNVKKIEEINQNLISESKPHYYTQSLMELGATLCKVSTPACEICPIAEFCQANKNSTQKQYPEFSSLKDKKIYRYVTFIIKDQHGNLILRKRHETLLEGFFEYPQVESESLNYAIEHFNELGISLSEPVFLKRVNHIFTHQTWHMDVYETKLLSGTLTDWYSIKDLKLVPMATAHKKIGTKA